MQLATIHVLIDVESDAEACDFLSETLSEMPYVKDWGHAVVPRDGNLAPYTKLIPVFDHYQEGDFYRHLRNVTLY